MLGLWSCSVIPFLKYPGHATAVDNLFRHDVGVSVDVGTDTGSS